MLRKILITGGSGLFALNSALALRDNFDVYLSMHKRQIQMIGTNSIQIDTESESGIELAIQNIHPDLILHSAAITSIETCESNPMLAAKVNTELPLSIAKICEKHQVKLVHMSTDHLFDGRYPLVDECFPVNPLNVYAKTKASAELKVLEAYPDTLVVRTNFYGWGPKYRLSLSDTIFQSLRDNTKINLFSDVFYTPILMESLILTIQELIELNASGIYHIVGDDRISKFEFGLHLAKEFNFDSNLIVPSLLAEQTNLAKRPLDMSLSNSKVTTKLGRNLGCITQQLSRLHELHELGQNRELSKIS